MELRSYYVLPRTVRWIFILAIAAASSAGVVRAQGMDSKGKDFWVTFMTNLGSEGENGVSDMRLYVSSDRPTTVTITYTMTGDSRTINLPVANVSTEFNVNAEFGGFVELSMVTNPSEEIQPKSLHVVADNEITLYGVDIRSKSADAYLGLPVDVLTGRYIVLAYPNGFSGSFVGNGAYDTPSEFAVVATEDNTQVNITPTSTLTINQRPAAPYSVMLSRGEVYFGQADVLPFNEQDVTGTQIDANKPVAVFGGNRRTSIPTRVGNYRDHLIEQLPPLDGWGRGGLLTPHFKVTPASTDTAVARIIAAFPGTDVTVTTSTGTQNITLSPGISYEVPLLEAMTVKGTQPIMMAQFEHSVNIGTGGAFDIGDPFMMLVVPTEQFDTAYAFQSIAHREFVEPHYINVVIPPQAVPSIRLDNAQVSNTFSPIPGSAYVYAQIQVPAGAHYIRADSAFGLYVYGFGQATSYGYPGGMLFRKLVRDFEPPELLTKDTCGEVSGFAFDSKITDTGIDSCYATKDTQNVMVAVESFTKGADTVHFTARLIDPYRDGVAAVRGVDGEGRSRTQIVAIPGFTIRSSFSSTMVPALLDTFVALNAKNFCRDIVLKNYGKFPQRISGVTLSDTTKRRVDPSQFPMTIAPGDTAVVRMCFEDVSDTLFTTLMSVIGDCAQREVALIPVDSRIDTTAPTVGIEGSPCSDDFLLTYYERFRASGIAAVEVDTTINCTAEKLIDPTKLPAQLVQVRLHRIDPRQDLIYKITLRDAVGNSLIDLDTIGGFTLNLLGRNGDTLGMRYNREWDSPDTMNLDGHRCDSVTITNYGSRAVIINHARMQGNLLYSLPPSQFPFVVPAGTQRKLLVCMDGHTNYDFFDTLMLFDACGHLEDVAMMTPLRSVFGTSGTSCGTVIAFAVNAPAKRAFLTTPQPNPVIGTAQVDVGLPVATDVTIDVFSSDGRPVLHVLDAAPLKAGISRVAFNVSPLDAGAYFCRMRTPDGAVHVAKMVVRR